jgi:hypothetical protein
VGEGVGEVLVDGEGDGCVADGFAEEPGDALLRRGVSVVINGGGMGIGVWERGGSTRARMESKSSERDLFCEGGWLVVLGGEGGRGGGP